jgi:hypothetical protein
MACNGSADQVFNYSVFEFDDLGNPHRTNKIFVLDMPKLIAQYKAITSEVIVVTFFKQMFSTINTGSGFAAIIDPPTNSYDVITIRWRTPHWKLVRIK